MGIVREYFSVPKFNTISRCTLESLESTQETTEVELLQAMPLATLMLLSCSPRVWRALESLEFLLTILCVHPLPDFIRRRTKYESVNYGISNY